MNENKLFVRSRHYCPLLSLLSFFKKGKIGAIFLDANLIWVAPECHNTGGLACLYHDIFGQNAYFQKR
jgi:hypothetical protein